MGVETQRQKAERKRQARLQAANEETLKKQQKDSRIEYAKNGGKTVKALENTGESGKIYGRKIRKSIGAQVKGQPVLYHPYTGEQFELVEGSRPVYPSNPLEVIDVTTAKGDISRTYYDEYGRRRMRVDSTDHGFPAQHPMGAHKHIIVYDEDGNYVKDTKPITLKAKDRKENADIL